MNRISHKIAAHKFEIVRYSVIVFVITPFAYLFAWFNIDNIAEKNRSIKLISEISEIQWRSEMVREEFLTTRNLIAIAAATDTNEYDSQIVAHFKFLLVNVKSMVAQPLLARLINSYDFSYLQHIIYLGQSQVVAFTKVGHHDYKALLKRIDSFKRETWRITTLASNATYMEARSNDEIKNRHISALVLGVWLALLFVVGLWFFISWRSKAQYNELVRIFCLLFSHMSVTRINGLNLWAHDCLSPDLSPDPAMLEKARNRLQYLTRMTHRLNQIARPGYDADLATLVPLKAVIDGLYLGEKHPRIYFVADEATAYILVADLHYHLILKELISNARDAQSTKIMICASLQQRLFRKRYLYIEVQDNGTGMSREQIKEATRPFYSTKGEANGHSGLGLHGCMALVRAMKGSFSIRSKFGRGATVRFACPVPTKK